METSNKRNSLVTIDPYFSVSLDLGGSSPFPEDSIWRAQHICVAESDAFHATVPDNAGQAIIKHQLRVKHFSVLEFAYVVLHYQGFPHDTVMQMARHQDSKPLVQSLRYTGRRFLDAAKDKTLIPTIFYYPSIGEYHSRETSYKITESQREIYFNHCWDATKLYLSQIEQGIPEETARRVLPAGYRQDFVLAGTIRALFHWLDQRTLKDSQLETQTLAEMTLRCLEDNDYCPDLIHWYRTQRATKNQLAP